MLSRKTLRVAEPIARCITKDAGRQSQQVVRIAAELGKALDFAASNGVAQIGVFGLHLGDRFATDGHGLADDSRIQGDI